MTKYWVGTEIGKKTRCSEKLQSERGRNQDVFFGGSLFSDTETSSATLNCQTMIPGR